jgi:hypothetical protein
MFFYTVDQIGVALKAWGIERYPVNAAMSFA